MAAQVLALVVVVFYVFVTGPAYSSQPRNKATHQARAASGGTSGQVDPSKNAAPPPPAVPATSGPAPETPAADAATSQKAPGCVVPSAGGSAPALSVQELDACRLQANQLLMTAIKSSDAGSESDTSARQNLIVRMQKASDALSQPNPDAPEKPWYETANFLLGLHVTSLLLPLIAISLLVLQFIQQRQQFASEQKGLTETHKTLHKRIGQLEDRAKQAEDENSYLRQKNTRWEPPVSREPIRESSLESSREMSRELSREFRPNPESSAPSPAEEWFPREQSAQTPAKISPSERAPQLAPDPRPDPRVHSGNPLEDYNRALSLGATDGADWFIQYYQEFHGLSCRNLDDLRLNASARLRFERDPRGDFMALRKDGKIIVLPSFKLDLVSQRTFLEGVFRYPEASGAFRLKKAATVQTSGEEEWILQQPGELERG